MNASRLFALTSAAMVAFAANSLLCRAALKQSGIDAASFTLVRILSGAVTLCIIAAVRSSHWREASNWSSALALFVYAAAFSFAYVTLSAGTGALLLFGAVQATMILWGFRRGERLRALQLVGLTVALIGLAVLVFPGVTAPPLIGSLLMLSAGVAWGVYSLRGKAARDPLGATAGNFARALPFALLLSAAFVPSARVDAAGLLYAVLSGAVASGVGYAIWYTALPALRSATAATVQLSVPVIAAAGAILLLGEPLTWRFVIAAIAVLGGIFLVVTTKSAVQRPE